MQRRLERGCLGGGGSGCLCGRVARPLGGFLQQEGLREGWRREHQPAPVQARGMTLQCAARCWSLQATFVVRMQTAHLLLLEAVDGSDEALGVRVGREA